MACKDDGIENEFIPFFVVVRDKFDGIQPTQIMTNVRIPVNGWNMKCNIYHICVLKSSM